MDSDGRVLQAMNSMCDLTQFVVSTLVENASSEILAQLFMETVVLSFGMVAVVVVDADSKFLGIFKEMLLKICHHISDGICTPLVHLGHFDKFK